MSTERQRSRDAGILDEAIEEMRGLLKSGGEPAISFAAADRIVKLTERRAKLLGLDLADRDGAEGDKPGSLAAVERRLEVVGKPAR